MGRRLVIGGFPVMPLLDSAKRFLDRSALRALLVPLVSQISWQGNGVERIFYHDGVWMHETSQGLFPLSAAVCEIEHGTIRGIHQIGLLLGISTDTRRRHRGCGSWCRLGNINVFQSRGRRGHRFLYRSSSSNLPLFAETHPLQPSAQCDPGPSSRLFSWVPCEHYRGLQALPPQPHNRWDGYFDSGFDTG
jgi:hypothetical protein